MSLQELHQTRGMDPTYLRRRQVAVGRVVERLCGFLIYDDGYSLSEVDTSSGDEDDVLFTDSGSDHASSTCIDEEDGRSHRHEDDEPTAEVLTPARVPVVINYEAEDELDAAVYYYAMRDAEENALNSNPWSWSEERVALPDAAVHMALRDCVIAFEKDAQPCSICLAPMRLGTRVAQLPCRHHFCRPCVVTWLKMAHTRPHCPICRAAVPIPRFHGPTSSSAPHSSQHPARSTGGVAPRHHHRSHHAQRRWERLMAEEEAALQQAMATQSLPQLPSRAKSDATSTKAPSKDHASSLPTSPTASFDELEKKSAWLRDFMESRRREDRIQRAREEGTRLMPPLPRVATLAKAPKRLNPVASSSASHSPKHLLPSPRR